MSSINPIALYRNETFGAEIRRRAAAPVPPRDGTASGEEHRPAEHERQPQRPAAAGPARACDFLVQLMVGADSDLRRTLGRRDVAERREDAYGSALARRPSAQPLSFVRIIGAA
jgi:hypothetical protein